MYALIWHLAASLDSLTIPMLQHSSLFLTPAKRSLFVFTFVDSSWISGKTGGLNFGAAQSGNG
jgi:hypothetical protein